MMNQAFTVILQKLITEQGKEALLNPAKCKSLLADYTRSEYKKESRLLLQAQEAGSIKVIDSAADIKLCKQQQVKVLREEYFMAEEAAMDLVDTLALILRGDTSKTEAPESAEKSGKTIPQDQMYYLSYNYQEKGPYKKPAIKTMITKGQINAAYYIRSADSSQWEPITELFTFSTVEKTVDNNSADGGNTVNPAQSSSQSQNTPMQNVPPKKKASGWTIFWVITFLVIIIFFVVDMIGVSTNQPETREVQQEVPFIFISGGNFIMGSPDTEEGRYPDEAQILATVNSFYMGIYEVTQQEYEAVVGNNPSSVKEPNLPVTNVSWEDARYYCNELSKKEGLIPVYDGTEWNSSANGYRLPTEKEWEYACRAGTTTPFSTNGYLINDVAWYADNSENQVHPVGIKNPNAWGLYDMHGNVYEWCWNENEGGNKMIRSGSFLDPVEQIRSAKRYADPANTKSGVLGFRIVRNAE